MNSKDVGYFLQVHFFVINQRWRKQGLHPLNHLPSSFGFGTRRKLTYRLASEMYEAQDLGFTKEETMQLFDAPETIVDYALEHRIRIGTEIMLALRELYKTSQITKPYLTEELREWK